MLGSSEFASLLTVAQVSMTASQQWHKPSAGPADASAGGEGRELWTTGVAPVHPAQQGLEQWGLSSAALQLQSLFLSETFSRKSGWLFYSFAKIRSQV